MSNRYTQLFLLPQNLYSEGAPILIEAGALLNDSQTNKILAQLKYKNLQEKHIKAMNIRIQPMDVLGNPLGDAISFQYLDLSVDCDEVFGSQTPINLPDNTTRGFSVEVCSVVFDDNSVWEATDASWETLNKPIPFYTGKNQELLKQYQLLYGSGAIYQLQVMKDLWQCVCGAIHKNTTPTCNVCRNSLTDLRRFDIDALKEECAQRLDTTAKADAVKRKKIRTLAIVMSSVVTVTVAIALLWNPVIHPFIKYNKEYNHAISLFESGEYEQAVTIFSSMPDYKNSDSKIKECNLLIVDKKYNHAVALMDAGKYTEAITAFKALGHYKDSLTKISECNTAIIDGKYNDAIALMDAGKYTEAITAFEALNGYKESTTKINECNTAILDGKYNDAIALMDAGKYTEAVSAFEALDGYKDSIDKAKVSKLKSATIGDYVFFGAYEQDNNTNNGKEDIEWLVLEVKNGKALVISKYALDYMPFNVDSGTVIWEKCTLRKWLNNDFINAAFSADQKAMIPTVTVSADKNPEYDTNPGNATQDQIFLLSIPEVNKYFGSYSARQCKPTSYAVAIKPGYDFFQNKDNCLWWLRSPGDSWMRTAACVSEKGDVSDRKVIKIAEIAVRPVMWIDITQTHKPLQ